MLRKLLPAGTYLAFVMTLIFKLVCAFVVSTFDKKLVPLKLSCIE